MVASRLGTLGVFCRCGGLLDEREGVILSEECICDGGVVGIASCISFYR